MDSNHKHVDWNIFWRTRGTLKKTFKGSLWDVEEVVKADNRIRRAEYVLISVGVNDVDTKPAAEVLAQIEKVVDLIKSLYGTPRKILAELTPQKDERDTEVVNCNI